MKSFISTLLSVGFLFLSCQGQPSKTTTTIDAKEFAQKLQSTKNPQLIDVRTPEEFSEDKINNATNIDWYDTAFATKVGKLDKSKPVFVYCKAGGRSAQAAAKLSELGFTEIYNLKGGIMKWNAEKSSKASSKIIGMCDQEYGELIKSSTKVMVDFNAKWCAPCQKMKPYIVKLEEELKSKIKIVSLDADENRTIVEQLKIDGLPTIIVYENGKEVWRNVGYISEEDLKKHL